MKAARILALILLLWPLAGCQTRNSVPRDAYRPPYEPENVAAAAVIPAHVRRVAVLPIFSRNDSKTDFVRELDGLFQSELVRSRAFEIVPLQRQEMKALFGSEQFESVAVLPDNFLHLISNQTGADAVLLSDLTVNQHYRPIALGVRTKLVDLQSGRIIWSVDTVFDSADPEIANAARHFAGAATDNPYPFDMTGSILQSPRRFADFVAFSLFRTLPRRS